MRKLEREKGRECVSSEYITQECEREKGVYEWAPGGRRYRIRECVCVRACVLRVVSKLRKKKNFLTFESALFSLSVNVSAAGSSFQVVQNLHQQKQSLRNDICLLSIAKLNNVNNQQ